MPSSMDAAEVVKEAENGSLPGAVIAGPMALDVAISETGSDHQRREQSRLQAKQMCC